MSSLKEKEKTEEGHLDGTEGFDDDWVDWIGRLTLIIDLEHL